MEAKTDASFFEYYEERHGVLSDGYCPECDGELQYRGESCEGTDLDGNRGELMETYVCEECSYELEVRTGVFCGKQF